MERDCLNPLVNSPKPFSPKVSFIGGKRSALTPLRNKSSRVSVSGRSTAQTMQVVLKSPYNCVEKFGQPLPVLITEALTFADRNMAVSARFSDCGYAWVVCGRRLLIWQYKQPIATTRAGTPKKPSNQSYELQLPQSDLAHKAELVLVFFSPESNSPSCIVVSPEGNVADVRPVCRVCAGASPRLPYNLYWSRGATPGVIRYWPAITHEGVSVEQVVDLQGQECDSLTCIGHLGCILATTTCSVVWIRPQSLAGRHTLNSNPLKTPSGWLGGLGKRMSSLIFGPISAEHSSETKLVRVLAVEETDCWTVYVLAGHSLQKWYITDDEDKLVFIAELTRVISENFHCTVWENCGADQAETDIWLLDMQVDKENIILLVAAVNMHVSPQVHYAMVALQTNLNAPPTSVHDFYLLKVSGVYREDNPADSLSYRFLVCGQNAYVFNERTITVVKPQEELDTLEFNGSQELLLYGTVCVNTPVFFSRLHGLVAVTSNELCPILNSSAASVAAAFETSVVETGANNLSLYSLDPEEMFVARKDAVGQLKAAFIFHIRNQHMACKDVIEALFVERENSEVTVDAVLDVGVVQVCEDLLNDIPAGDPRWSFKLETGIGSSYSMQVLHQLEDKQRAHALFIKFLQETELWAQLGVVTVRDTVSATAHILAECYEKLVAAVVLKNYSNSPIFQEVVNNVINGEEVPPESGLTKQDVFFREISKVYRVLQELAEICEQVVHTDRNPSDVSILISEANEILLVVMKEVAQYRQQNLEYFKPSARVLSFGVEYLPWTAAPGNEGLSDSLLQQQSLTISHGVPNAKNSQLKETLYDQFVFLIDFILHEKKNHLESIKGTSRKNILFKQYEIDRRKFILPLVEDQQWERAAALAEKYLDFELLAVVCEKTHNQDRLNDYMERFAKEGFSEFIYGWYLQENEPGKLINQCRVAMKPQRVQTLTTFLANHPSLLWIQNVFDRKFASAADILRHLAENESESITRKRTMFSLSKLAKLAAPDMGDLGHYMELINSNLELIAFQEDIPDYVLQHYGYNTEKLQVIAPKDLIHLYTCVQYKEATEVEFKKALDVAEFVIDSELRDKLKLKIWKRVVLRDGWIDAHLDSPLEILQSTLFFKLVDLAIALGADPQALLPPLDTLVDSLESTDLPQNKNFQYLIKAGYEHVYKTFVIES